MAKERRFFTKLEMHAEVKCKALGVMSKDVRLHPQRDGKPSSVLIEKQRDQISIFMNLL